MKHHLTPEKTQSQMAATMWSFAICLTIGSLLLVGYIGTRSGIFLAAGIMFVPCAFLFNLVVLIGNIGMLCYRGLHQPGLLWRTALLLLNIPIAMFYLDVVVRNL